MTPASMTAELVGTTWGDEAQAEAALRREHERHRRRAALVEAIARREARLAATRHDRPARRARA